MEKKLADFKEGMSHIFGEWGAYMSGLTSIPFTAITILRPDSDLRTLWFAFAIAMVWLTAYQIWRKGKQEIDRLRNEIKAFKENKVERDVNLYNAIYYICFGTWEIPQSSLSEQNLDANIIGKLERIFLNIPQYAVDGKIPIWGRKIQESKVWEQVPTDLWKTETLAWIPFAYEKIMKFEPSPDNKFLAHLMTSKVAIERLVK